MSYESRAYDQMNDDGFGPDPVVVLVVKGTHDVSRLVSLLNGGQPVIEQMELGRRIVEQVRRDEGGRAALRLLAQHGGPDFSMPNPIPGLTDPLLHALRGMVAGQQIKQVAREVHLTPSGLAMKLLRLRQKLGMVSNEQLVALCVHRGLIDPPAVTE